MKIIFHKQLVSSFTSVLVITSLAFATQGAEESLERMLAEVKREGSAAPLLDYVNWELAYSKLPANEKKALGVKSVSEFEAQQRRYHRDTLGYVVEQFESQDPAHLPDSPDARSQLREVIMQATRAQLEKQNSLIKKSQYRVKKQSGLGEKEVVLEFSVSLEGLADVRSVEVVRDNGGWQLTGIPDVVPPVGTQGPRGDSDSEQSAVIEQH